MEPPKPYESYKSYTLHAPQLPTSSRSGPPAPPLPTSSRPPLPTSSRSGPPLYTLPPSGPPMPPMRPSEVPTTDTNMETIYKDVKDSRGKANYPLVFYKCLETDKNIIVYVDTVLNDGSGITKLYEQLAGCLNTMTTMDAFNIILKSNEIKRIQTELKAVGRSDGRRAELEEQLNLLLLEQLAILNEHIPRLKNIISESKKFLSIFEKEIERIDSNLRKFNDPHKELNRIYAYLLKLHGDILNKDKNCKKYEKTQNKICVENQRNELIQPVQQRHDMIVENINANTELSSEQRTVLHDHNSNILALLIATYNEKAESEINILIKMLNNKHDLYRKQNEPIWTYKTLKDDFINAIKKLEKLEALIIKKQTFTMQKYDEIISFLQFSDTPSSVSASSLVDINTFKLLIIDEIKLFTQDIEEQQLKIKKNYEIQIEQLKNNEPLISIINESPYPSEEELLRYARPHTRVPQTFSEIMAQQMEDYLIKHPVKEEYPYERTYGESGLKIYVRGDPDGLSARDFNQEALYYKQYDEDEQPSIIWKKINPTSTDPWERICFIRLYGSDEEKEALIREFAANKQKRLEKQEEAHQRHILDKENKRKLYEQQLQFKKILQRTMHSNLVDLDTEASEGKSSVRDDADITRMAVSAPTFTEGDTPLKSVRESSRRKPAMKKPILGDSSYETIKGLNLPFTKSKTFLKNTTEDSGRIESENNKYKQIMSLIISLVIQQYINPSWSSLHSSDEETQETQETLDSVEPKMHSESSLRCHVDMACPVDFTDSDTDDASSASGPTPVVKIVDLDDSPTPVVRIVDLSDGVSESKGVDTESPSVLKYLPIVESEAPILIKALNGINRLFSNIVSTNIKSTNQTVLEKVNHIVPIEIIKYVKETQTLTIKTHKKVFRSGENTAHIYQIANYDLLNDTISFTLYEDTDENNKFVFSTEYVVMHPSKPNEQRQIIINPVSQKEHKKIKPIHRTMIHVKPLINSSHVNIFKLLNDDDAFNAINISTPLDKIKGKLEAYYSKHEHELNPSSRILQTPQIQLKKEKYKKMEAITSSEQNLKDHIQTLTQWRNDYCAYKKIQLFPIESLEHRIDYKETGKAIVSKKYHRILNRYHDYDKDQVVFETVINRRFRSNESKQLERAKQEREEKSTGKRTDNEAYTIMDIGAVNYGINHAYLVSDILNYNTYSKSSASEKLCLNHTNISDFCSFVHSFKSCVFSIVSLFWQIMDYINEEPLSSGAGSGSSADAGAGSTLFTESRDGAKLKPLIIDFNFSLVYSNCEWLSNSQLPFPHIQKSDIHHRYLLLKADKNYNSLHQLSIIDYPIINNATSYEEFNTLKLIEPLYCYEDRYSINYPLVRTDIDYIFAIKYFERLNLYIKTRLISESLRVKHALLHDTNKKIKTSQYIRSLININKQINRYVDSFKTTTLFTFNYIIKHYEISAVIDKCMDSTIFDRATLESLQTIISRIKN